MLSAQLHAEEHRDRRIAVGAAAVSYPLPRSAPEMAAPARPHCDGGGTEATQRSGGPSRDGAVVALGTLHAGEINPGKQHDQVGGADLDLGASVRRGREAKGAALEPLVPDRVS